MAEKYLIDGYNLMHAAGMMPEEGKGRGLEKARGHLLRTLAFALRNTDKSATVIFDASQRFPGGRQDESFHGIEARFASDYDEADDMIEDLIKKSPVPRRMTVVSDDHRVQRAAGRRRCTVMSCGEFQDELEKLESLSRREEEKKPKAEKSMSETEKQHWLAEFADLQNDPVMKELFDPFGFNEALD